jgi:NADH-quinone oxidoreductase subunit A
MILTRYLVIGLVLCMAVAFALLPIIAMNILAPRKKSASKADTYECGVLPTGETWVRFRIQYYIYALLFVVFDIETIFLYPWAAAYGGLGLFALIEMVIFLGMLVVGLAYAWSRGVLRWV